MVTGRHKLVSKIKQRAQARSLRYPETCPNCQKKRTIRKLVTIKCINCGFPLVDFGKEPKSGWRLKTQYDSSTKEITILGNVEGLEFLASSCLAVIGKADPSGHVHLQWQMNNLLPGSTSIRLEFSNDPADYR